MRLAILPTFARGALAAAIFVACALLGACAEVPTLDLHDWQLRIEGEAGEFAVRLPGPVGHGADRHESTYHLRATVEVPTDWRGHDLVLGIEFLRSPTRFYADGIEVPSIDEHVLDASRPMTPHRYRIDGRATTAHAIELEVVVHCLVSQASHIVVVPRLSKSEFGDRRLRVLTYFNAWTHVAALFATLAIALVSLLVWFSTPQGTDPKPIELTRLAFSCALYAASQQGALQPFVGVRDFGVLFAAMLWGALATVQLARLYRGVPPVSNGVVWVFRSLFVFLPLIQTRFVAAGFTVVLLFAMVLAFSYVAVSAFEGARELPELRWMLGCWCVVLLTGAHDGALALGIPTPFGGAQLTCSALLVFVIAQAALLSRDQAKLHERLRAHVAVVDQHNREVRQLNDELRRKVGDRSRELASALRRLEHEGQSMLVPGAVLADLYRVTTRLGAGAMGEVYRVERLSDGRSLAAKVVRGRVRPEALQRFTREAELAARIDHPNVVRVLDVDVSSGGDLFLVMELVDGPSLEELRASYGDRRFATTMIGQIASALHAIHGGNIVHRDLKPSNVLVEQGVAKVADFGIAGCVGESRQPTARPGSSTSDDVSGEALAATLDAQVEASPQLTVEGAIMGTPLYMAPEVLAGEPVTSAADLFSFALIAYQLVGGGSLLPEDVPGPRNLFRRKALRSFADVAPWLGAGAAAALDHCLEREPARRPTAAEMVTAVASLHLQATA